MIMSMLTKSKDSKLRPAAPAMAAMSFRFMIFVSRDRFQDNICHEWSFDVIFEIRLLIFWVSRLSNQEQFSIDSNSLKVLNQNCYLQKKQNIFKQGYNLPYTESRIQLVGTILISHNWNCDL
jgi:hypothetical protein